MATRKTRGGFARAAVSAALTGVLALGGAIAPVGVAWAEDERTVTIYDAQGEPKKADDDSVTGRKAILVFKADKIDNSKNDLGGLATGAIQWGSETETTGVKAKVTDFLKKDASETGASVSYIQWLVDNKLLTGDNASAKTWDDIKNDTGANGGVAVFEDARNAARYIGEEIAKANKVGTPYVTKTEDPNVPNITGINSFADGLASALSGVEEVVTISVSTSGNATFGLTQTGYYLVTGTRPTWLPFNNEDGDVDIYDKSDIPTLEKDAYEGPKALDDLDATDFQKTVDAGNGETVTFRLVASIPAGSYDKMQFTDTLPATGFDINSFLIKSVTKQYIDSSTGLPEQNEGGTEIAPAALNANDYAASAIEDNTFTVLLPEAGGAYTAGKQTVDETTHQVTATYDEIVTVTYQLKLSQQAGMGADHLNVNTARLSYGTGQAYSNEATASVASFQLEIVKIDSETGDPLTGSVFNVWDTMGTTEGDTPTSDDKALKADGSLATDGNSVDITASTGDSQNVATVQRVDAATYLVHEKTAPAGKAPIADFTVKVDPQYDNVTGELTALNVEAKSADGTDTTASVAAEVKDGKVTITVPNGASEVRLPVTGMTPSQLGTIAGVVLVAVGAFVVIRRRNQEDAA